MRQQHDLRLAAELVVDVGRRRVAQHLAGQILRRVEQRGRGRRHDGADIAARPDHLLQTAAERGRIDRRGDHRADLRGAGTPDLLDHLGAHRCRRARPDMRGRDPSRPLQARGSTPCMNSRSLSCAKARTFSVRAAACRPARAVERREQPSASVMPGGPSCAMPEPSAGAETSATRRRTRDARRSPTSLVLDARRSFARSHAACSGNASRAACPGLARADTRSRADGRRHRGDDPRAQSRCPADAVAPRPTPSSSTEFGPALSRQRFSRTRTSPRRSG